MSRTDFHRYCYIFCLTALVICMPLSHFAMGLTSVLLLINWLLEWNWKEKKQILSQYKQGLVFAALFLVCCLALIQTNDLKGGLHNLLTKLPFLFAPLIMITTKPLSPKEVRFILNGFIVSTLFCCVYSTIYWLTHEVSDIRRISVFIDHIRFSLCIDMAIVFCGYFVVKVREYSKQIRVLYVLMAALMTIYLFLAQTLTGIVILFAILIAYMIYCVVRMPKNKVIWSLFVCVLVLLVAAVSYVAVITYQYYHNQDRKITTTKTALGNDYSFNSNSFIENGHLIAYYVCKPELRAAWSMRSDTVYTEFLEQTLIRYLNSKGLHKDYAGVMQLTDSDIHFVEQSIANAEYVKPFGLRRALYPTFFSLSMYAHYHYIDNSSFLQRVELWNASLKVIRSNWGLGVGVGDQKTALDAQLEAQQSPIAHKLNRGCHNQFLTFWMMGGLVLLTYFIFMLIYPFFALRKKIGFVYIAFFILMILSMLVEDTLETQTGRMLFSIFNPLILFYLSDAETDA